MRIALPIFLLLASPCFAAIPSVSSSIRACDNSASVSSTSSPVNVSASISNPVLVVFVGAFDSVTFANTAATGVTYNGVALTKIQESIQPTTNRSMSAWVLPNPARGSNTLTTTWAGSALGGHVHAIVVQDANQSIVVDASTGTTIASAASFPISISTMGDNSLVLSFCSTSTNILTTRSAPLLGIQNATNNFWWSSYTLPTQPPQSLTHTYSNGTTDAADIIAVSIAQTSPTGMQIRGGRVMLQGGQVIIQ